MSHTTLEPLPLHDGPPPGTEDWTHEERTYFSELFGTRVVTNVVTPSITPVVPDRPCGTALVIAPGGGFHALSIDSEGNDVAHRLAEVGVTSFVLRYRLVPSGEDAVAELFGKDPARTQDDMLRVAPLGGADAIAALHSVRRSAGDFAVAPDRVGVIGFSAGGNVVLQTAYAPEAGDRPDFVAAVYPSTAGLEVATPPPSRGPMFLAAASDDPLGLADDAVAVYDAWREGGVSTELHLYAAGGHGFGMRRQGLPADGWIDRFVEWLDAGGFLADRDPGD